MLPGKAQSNPAPSCQWLDHHFYNLNNGYYWIVKKSGGGGELSFCDMKNGGVGKYINQRKVQLHDFMTFIPEKGLENGSNRIKNTL